MRKAGAFFSLVRWPNLVFIALTQCLFYFAVVPLAIPSFQPGYLNLNFYLLVLASVFIAAAGYIINDYFDVQIDAINKPQKLIIGKKIKRRWAIAGHLGLSLAGLLLSFYISIASKNLWIGIGNFGCILLLWVYSVSLKRMLLLGNIAIAILTAWVIIVIYFFVEKAGLQISGIHKLFKFTLLYSAFAFIVTIIREVIKDIEDMDGDREYNSKTLPIAWGIPVAKIFTAVWIVVCIGLLLAVQLYAFQLSLWYIILYSLILLVMPLLWLLYKLYIAKQSEDYNCMSSIIKLIMLAGILSMLFFFLSF